LGAWPFEAMAHVSWLYAACLFALLEDGATATRRNILFVVVDDMRPNIGAYNFSLAHTPNLDRLASEGLTLKRAYVQYAFCAPSRNSFMSGRRPDTTQVWNFQNHFREAGIGDTWETLPGFFKKHGYLTMGSGKLFHPKLPPDNDYNMSFSPEQPYYSPECAPPACPSSSASGPANGPYECLEAEPPWEERPTWCSANISKSETRFEFQLEDQRIRDSCISQMRYASKKDTPFFLGCGFHRPHVPWIVPHEFVELYPRDLEQIPLAKYPYAPTGMPDVAWHHPADVKGMSSGFNDTCNATRSRILRRGYYAAVSYTDDNIGKLLNALDELGLADSTAVVVFSDHGFNLGEQAVWAKMTNFELATRTPAIFRVPWIPASRGRVSNVLAEAVDFYPTLTELAGLPEPRSVGEDINGTSLVPVFREAQESSIKRAAFSQYAKQTARRPFDIWPTPDKNATKIMGYSVRIDKWRYTAWFGLDGATPEVLPHEIWGRELYSHQDDDGDLDFGGENVNVVDDPANKELANELHKMVLDYIQLWSTGVQKMSVV